MRVSINCDCNNSQKIQIYQTKFSNKNQVAEKQEFSPEKIHSLLSKDEKKISYELLWIVTVSKYSKFNYKIILLRVRSSKNNNFLLNVNQASIEIKTNYTIMPFRYSM